MPRSGPGQSPAKMSAALASPHANGACGRGVDASARVSAPTHAALHGVRFLQERSLTIFRRYFPVQTAADGLAAGGMHASRVCRGRVFGTTARLVCRLQAHLATSAPVVFAIEIRKAPRRLRRRLLWRDGAYRSGGAPAASKLLMIIPADGSAGRQRRATQRSDWLATRTHESRNRLKNVRFSSSCAA